MLVVGKSLTVRRTRSNGEIKHIRVTNTADGKFSLGKSKDEFASIWDLIEAQLDKSLKSTKGDQAVQLVYVAPHVECTPFPRLPFPHPPPPPLPPLTTNH